MRVYVLTIGDDRYDDGNVAGIYHDMAAAMHVYEPDDDAWDIDATGRAWAWKSGPDDERRPDHG